MKGYTVLAVLALATAVLTPLAALPKPSRETPPSAEQPQTTPDAQGSASDEATFRVKNEKTGETVTMTEEAFLIGIVSCEIAPSSPAEALKAQAVAAYTYYCKQRAAAADGVFSNVPETLFTAGSEAGMRERLGERYDELYGAVRDAVRAVAGQKILYNGEPITACYHAISAGLTDSAADVWGGNYPYLQPVDSSGDLTADGYETTVTKTAEEVAAALKALDQSLAPDGDPAGWFTNSETTASGLVKTAVVCGKSFSGGKLREALSLRSACFTVRCTGRTFTFTVRGYGHNVGMSQTGARYMANGGAGYREILSHYYPGTTVA